MTPRSTTPTADAIETGTEIRSRVPRGVHGEWTAAEDRADPVAILLEQDEFRSADLVPIRHGRMGASSFAFYRGAAAIMAADLAATPTTGLTVQLCGDAHLSNFGVFASPERQLLFDLNDFDETLPGPWEWDLKRLVTSFTIAARSNGLRGRQKEDAAALACAASYRSAMAEFAGMTPLDTWYARTNADEVVAAARQYVGKEQRRRAEANLARARQRTSLNAARRLCTEVDGRLRIVDDPPLVMPLSTVVSTRQVNRLRAGIKDTYHQYRESLLPGPRGVLEGYEFVDIAHKIVGIGSVGLRAFIGLLQCRRTGAPLLLQMKEARASVLEKFLQPSEHEQPGHRVVEGQRQMQAASDIFLGWSASTLDGRHYYWRQLRDMKASADIDHMGPAALAAYARVCGWSLARAHARSGQPAVIAGYLGNSDRFDRAMAEFAHRYADQNEVDFAAHQLAVADGRVRAVTDL